MTRTMGKMEPESLLEDLPIGIFRLASDQSGKILDVNSEFKVILGYQEINDLDDRTIGGAFSLSNRLG